MYHLEDASNGFAFFVCDTVADIQKLPKYKTANADGMKCSYGSKALVIEGSKLYILRQDTDEWTAM